MTLSLRLRTLELPLRVADGLVSLLEKLVLAGFTPRLCHILRCPRCHSALVWLFSGRTRVWVAFATVPGHSEQLRVHGCPLYGDPVPSWRHLEEQTEQTIRAGAARVRQVLAAKEIES